MKLSATFRIRATGPGLTVIACIDDHEIYHGEPGSESVLVTGEFDDNVECDRTLTITLSGKLPEHTEISESGEIVQDRVVEIYDVSLDDIPLEYAMIEKSTYVHDQNGTVPEFQDKFYGTMGCNGTVELKFSTPVYLWLLENL